MMKTERTGINVYVTPELQQGDAVFCEIDRAPGTPGHFVRGGAVKLPAGGQYEINFILQTGQVPGLEFDANDPFCSDPNTCPAPGQNDGQYTNPRVTAPTTLTVDADPAPPRNAVHYRLNFSNGTYCDPIIING
jgi:hypothetical protein